jgi:SUKH-4 immunity protein
LLIIGVFSQGAFTSKRIMTTEQFKNKWTSTGDKLSPIDKDKLVNLSLSNETIEFLNSTGLPDDAAPFLSFAKNTTDIFDGVNKLTSQYDFLEQEFEKYIVIGSCGDGDPIVINTSNNDQIEWLDHEDYFSSRFFNSSIKTLANCLLVYRDFVLTVQKENGEDAFINAEFTDEQFSSLKEQLTLMDNRTTSEDGFWQAELDMELGMRDDARKE